MATIVTRTGKGSPLTNAEVDANFDNLNNDKIESVPVASSTTSGTIKVGSGLAIDGSGVLTASGATNLSSTPASTNVAIESSTGTNTTLPAATTSAAGVLSAADKTKLDGGAGSGLNADLLDGQHGSYYTSYADTAVSNLVDSSPAALNTLNELAAALGDDANFSTTITDSVATKLPLAGGQITGNITMAGSQTVDGRDLSVDGAKLDGIAASANNYTHPTGNGNNHIPSGGSAGKYLKYASAGTAQWGDNELALSNFEYTATANQTTFQGSDNNSATLAYISGAVIVSLNGVILDDGSDYTASNGTSIVLASGAAVGDHLAVIAFVAFSVSDTVAASTGGTFAGGVTVSGTLTANSAAINANGSGGTTGIHVNKNDINGYYFQAEFDGGTNNNRTYNLKPPSSDSNSEPFIWSTGNSHAWEVDGSEVLRIGSSKAIGLSGANYGTAGQVLTSAGSSAAPSWASPAVGFAHTLNSGNPAGNSNPSAIGHMWINTTSGETFICINATTNNNTWVSTGVGATANIVAFSATGGVITTSGSYTIHTFLSSANFVVNAASTKAVEYLIVAGGAGGGHQHQGGGGAGGFRTNVSGATSGGGASAEAAMNVTSGTYSIVVGAGGAGASGSSQSGGVGTSGGNSSFNGITSLGGGGGGSWGGNQQGAVGGSGGGSGSYPSVVAGGAGTSGQGYAGGQSSAVSAHAGGGGGGAGGLGANATGSSASASAGAGGVGQQSSISGSATYYAGGGGGGNYGSNQNNVGGNGGGGHGGADGSNNTALSAGTANTGGGGGGSAAWNGGAAAQGGSGIVIIRYLT